MKVWTYLHSNNMVHKGTIIVYIMNTDMWQEVQINNMIKHMYMY
jgi:hypothetical protein